MFMRLPWSRGFVLVFAEIGDAAAPAFWLTRFADIAPVQDQPVVGVLLVLLGNRFEQFKLDGEWRFSGR